MAALDDSTMGDVHYRLYLDADGEPCVICVQWFDYPDYDASRFLTEDRHLVEAEAEAALGALLDRHYLDLLARLDPVTAALALLAPELALSADVTNDEALDRWVFAHPRLAATKR